MAARKGGAAEGRQSEVVEVEVGGRTVQVDLSYARSWAGVRQAAKMASSQLPDSDRFVALLEYYEAVVPNIDEVTQDMADDDANTVIEMLAAAVKEATPKN